MNYYFKIFVDYYVTRLYYIKADNLLKNNKIYELNYLIICMYIKFLYNSLLGLSILSGSKTDSKIHVWFGSREKYMLGIFGLAVLVKVQILLEIQLDILSKRNVFYIFDIYGYFEYFFGIKLFLKISRFVFRL